MKSLIVILLLMFPSVVLAQTCENLVGVTYDKFEDVRTQMSKAPIKVAGKDSTLAFTLGLEGKGPIGMAMVILKKGPACVKMGSKVIFVFGNDTHVRFESKNMIPSNCSGTVGLVVTEEIAKAFLTYEKAAIRIYGTSENFTYDMSSDNIKVIQDTLQCLKTP